MARQIRATAERTGESSDASIAQRARTVVPTDERLGTAAMLAGGALVVRALRAERRTLTSLQAFAGAALLGLGLRQRLRGEGGTELTTSETGRTRADERNPRGTEDVRDVETEPDEGRIQFTDHRDEQSHSHPDLDDESSDPRVDQDDEDVTVDLSEAALADEASEATGPTTEQAMPAQTDATEPDTSPDEDVSNVQSDEAAVEEYDERRQGVQVEDERADDERSDDERADDHRSGDEGSDDEPSDEEQPDADRAGEAGDGEGRTGLEGMEETTGAGTDDAGPNLDAAVDAALESRTDGDDETGIEDSDAGDDDAKTDAGGGAAVDTEAGEEDDDAVDELSFRDRAADNPDDLDDEDGEDAQSFRDQATDNPDDLDDEDEA